MRAEQRDREGAFCPGDLAGVGDGAGQRSLGAHGRAGGPVEIGGGAAWHIQASSAATGQTPRSARSAQIAARWPAPCRSVLERRMVSSMPFLGTRSTSPRARRTSSERPGCAEADQQRGALAGGGEGQGRDAQKASAQSTGLGTSQRGRTPVARVTPSTTMANARLAQIERAAGQRMRRLDRGQRTADRADGEARVDQADDVHRDGVRHRDRVGIGAGRGATETRAPGLAVGRRALGLLGQTGERGGGRISRGGRWRRPG